MYYRPFIILILAAFSSTDVFAQTQYCDLLSYRGKTERLEKYNFPLEYYFIQYPERRPYHETTPILWQRGYIAAFEIVEDSLFVRKVSLGASERSDSIAIHEMFPEYGSFAGWFSGELYIPYGRNTRSRVIHVSGLRKHIVLEIDNGILIKKSKRKNTYVSTRREMRRWTKRFIKSDEFKK